MSWLHNCLNKNVYSFTASVTRISSKAVTKEGTENFDSDKGDHEPSYDRLIGTPLTIQIDRNGRVVQPFRFAGSQKESGSVIDMSKIQVVFPGKEISVGDTWKNESRNDEVKITTKATYTLKEVTETEIKIAMVAEMINTSGMIGPQKLKGEYTLDRKTTRLKQARLEVNPTTGGTMVFKLYEK